ncbi:TRAP transporter small permease [Algoriphagus sediminis]|uniref:TRAP transporter small permease n=1 Tax=Algoriphagus sediminis TaxID=3057113 RepID=A0ABT7YD96_9BACT|nr:TRAP transporter small permease [Algoriphagus sediminis]MDN3204502.1 TRAP transporter small permease [Algoriphagus sediminis]
MKEKLDKVLGTSIVVLMGLMVINVTWQVVSRYIFGDPSSWTDEVARYLLVWLGLLGAAYVSGRNGHLAIDILPSKLQGKKARILQYFIHSVIILFAAIVMVAGGGNLVYITEILDQRTATLQVPLSWIYLMIPISGVMVMIYHGLFLVSIKTKYA